MSLYYLSQKKRLTHGLRKYPDVAGIVEAIADKKANERLLILDARLTRDRRVSVHSKERKGRSRATNIHPDFAQIREDDAFHTWAEEQPKWVQDALYENQDDAKSVARVIDLYKSDKGIQD